MSVEILSDSELRTKLAEYGYPVGPVTQTTRKILVKKLKTLMEAHESGTKGTSRHSLAAKYSSDDTDDDSVAIGRKKKSNSSRRQTLANPMPPPALVVPRSPSKRRSAARTANESSDSYLNFVPTEAVTSKSTVKTVQNKKVTKTFGSSNDGMETGSDSDITDEPERIYSTSKYKVSTEPAKAPEAKTYDNKTYDTRNERNIPINVSDYQSFTKPHDNKQRSIFTARDEPYSPPAFKPNVSPIPKEDVYRDSNDPLANIETPYLSDFTRRLSRLSTGQLPSRQSMGTPILRHSRTSVAPEVKETDTNGHFSSLRAKYLPSTTRFSSTYSTLVPERPIMTRSFQSDGKEIKNHHNLISIVLLCVLLLFFVVLAIVYLGLGGGKMESASSDGDKTYPLCLNDASKSTPNCWQQETLETATQLLNRLQPLLTDKAISYNCDDATDAPYISEKDIILMFIKKDLNESIVEEDLSNAESLILANGKSEISLIKIEESTEFFTDSKVLKTMEEVYLTRRNGKVGMVILNPSVPMKCLIRNKLYPLLSTILIIAIGALIIIGMQKLFVWYLKQKKESENEVFRLVSEIISMLELHHQNSAVASPGGTQESYLAINHVRDNLIPPIKRKQMAGIWEKAVTFLDENESRVRREVQQVAGEEFHVWRWLPSNNLNSSNIQTPNAGSKKSKVWQGQAFETMEGSVNSLPCSPTPCLKIRHMFDPDVEFEDDWEIKVQDAILEKCGEDVKILHIRVDRKSGEGCVYMRCMSQEDAGKAYRALHGWWFDSKLVTVKYLRLERYHARFPDAARCTTPLQPSNNKRLSMQAHNWQSPLETI